MKLGVQSQGKELKKSMFQFNDSDKLKFTIQKDEDKETISTTLI